MEGIERETEIIQRKIDIIQLKSSLIQPNSARIEPNAANLSDRSGGQFKKKILFSLEVTGKLMGFSFSIGSYYGKVNEVNLTRPGEKSV